MTTLDAMRAGWEARRNGAQATDNPYLDFDKAVAWSVGWHAHGSSRHPRHRDPFLSSPAWMLQLRAAGIRPKEITELERMMK